MPPTKKSASPKAPAKKKAVKARAASGEDKKKETVKKTRAVGRAKKTPAKAPSKKITEKSEVKAVVEPVQAPTPEKAAAPAEQVQAAPVAAPEKVSAESVPESQPEPAVVKPEEETSPAAEETPVEEIKTEAPKAPEAPAELKRLELATPITVRELAVALEIKPTELIAKFIKAGVFASMNQSVQFEMASKIAAEYGFLMEEPHALEHDLAGIHHEEVNEKNLVSRSPIVTFMGHVDHGKTSLMDAIRKTKVVEKESGGITQHIGAYRVELDKGAVTFLDTPGHEAFTAMRARGARCTDVVVLVVAADSGVMPQTIEAIDHARAAEAPIVVAINKCDLPSADLNKVKKGLAEHGLVPEDWGGTTITVNVSAKTGQGVGDLLEMLALESELLELRADPTLPARGSVIEAELSKMSGPTATLLVQNGTLKVTDAIVCGMHYGKIKAMRNYNGKRIEKAAPADPVEVLGLSGVPQAGDIFYVVKNEIKARELIDEKQMKEREKSLLGSAHISLEQLYDQIKAGKISTLKLIIKADMQGSVEALRAMIERIPPHDVKLSIIHSGTGDITASDVLLAAASDAIIIGFHVDVVSAATEAIKREEVDVRLYEIIYEAQNAIIKALEGMLEPEMLEVRLGTAEVRQVFKISKTGVIAGSMVQKGKLIRNATCRVFRNSEKIYEGRISGLKRFKNDAREVVEGFECGIQIDGFSNFEPGDQVYAFTIEEKARTIKSS